MVRKLVYTAVGHGADVTELYEFSSLPAAEEWSRKVGMVKHGMECVHQWARLVSHDRLLEMFRQWLLVAQYFGEEFGHPKVPADIRRSVRDVQQNVGVPLTEFGPVAPPPTDAELASARAGASEQLHGVFVLHPEVTKPPITPATRRCRETAIASWNRFLSSDQLKLHLVPAEAFRYGVVVDSQHPLPDYASMDKTMVDPKLLELFAEYLISTTGRYVTAHRHFSFLTRQLSEDLAEAGTPQSSADKDEIQLMKRTLLHTFVEKKENLKK